MELNWNSKYDACFYLNLPKVLNNQIQHHQDHRVI